MSSPYLFVYGTLRSGSGTDWSRRLAAQAELIGRGRVAGVLFKIGSYPGMTPAEREGDSVIGEVFRLADPEKLWPELDAYEGNEYERRDVPVHMDDGELVNAWVYYYRGDTSVKSRIVSGDWIEGTKTPERAP
jgi:gamma-glutamylcyclotransferase (GGCT)/AIG2-like uncharacterized protein YtfP